MDKLEMLKFNLMEKQYPYFDDSDLQVLLEKNSNDVNKASYEGLLIKAENTEFSVSGLNAKDNSNYFKMLATKYRPNNSGILRG